MLRPFRDAADTRCDAEIVPPASSSAAYSAEDSEAPGALSACFPADLPSVGSPKSSRLQVVSAGIAALLVLLIGRER